MERAQQRIIEGYARAYRLRLPERQRIATAGDLAGKRTGSSVEYQDRKDYVPGDDLRHVDWRAYARTDRLTVKLYREEISPRVDIIVDTSESMKTSEDKAQRAIQLAVFFHLLAGASHAITRVHDLGSRLLPISHPLDLERARHSRVESPLPLLQAAAFSSRGGIKVLISDFLFPCDPGALRSAFRQADRLLLVQILSAFEARPEAGREWRLQDAETNEFLDVGLTGQIVQGYVQRLRQVQEGLDRQMRLGGGAFAVIQDNHSWEQIVRALLRAGMVEPQAAQGALV